MKKNLTRLSLIAILFFPFSYSFGQVLRTHVQNVTSFSKEKQGTVYNTSPHLNIDHDHEHCISDALTNDWIESYDIVDEYKTSENRQNQLAQQNVGGARATYTIPIVFHVIHNPNNPAENVSQTAINNLLNAVNLDFTASNTDIGNLRTGFGWTGADADITFCLAQKDPWGNPLTELGIHRVATTEDYYDPSTESNKMKGSTGGNTGTAGWDRTSYVNVWICDIANGASSGTAGYAYKPTISSLPPASIDGIVIDYNLGMPPTNRVLTHEIGHYLGLAHTWGNSNSASGCAVDDGLTDTPVTAGPSFNYGGSCAGSQQTCAGTETQYENFMDYSNCQVIYTAQQASLMAQVLNGSRASLQVSTACVPINPQPPVAQFTADLTTVIAGGSINFTDQSTNYPTSWNWVSAPAAGVTFVNGTTASSQNSTMQFTNPGLYTITLTATNAYGTDNEVKTSYINVVAAGGGAVACDTIRNYTAPEQANMTAYSLTGGTGFYPGSLYLPGTNNFQMDNIADSFYVNAPTEVRRIYLPVYKADDLGGANNVIFTVWNNNGATPGPGAILGTESVPISSLNAGFWNEIDFFPAIPVNGEFWVGVQFDHPNTTFQDTVLFATTDFGDRPSGQSSTWVQGWEPQLSVNFVWQSATSFFTVNPNCSLILDVLTSNGPAPTAVASWPVSETCEGMDVTMNGFGSTNTTSYYWDITDGSNDYFYDQGNLTTTLTAGTWTFNLEADGSCLTDIDGPFVMTVNPPLTATFNVTAENCIAADGAITINLSGGNGGPYTYSINNGVTTQGTNSYSNLISGNYNYLLVDNANCELEGTINVGNNNTFTPTITPDATILAGTATTLSVTGGTAWTWYANEGAGPIQIATTQTVNVAPTVTTSYSCNVENGSGCEAELEVTLTVSNPVAIAENLVNSFSIFPNPSNGEFQLIFNLAQAKDLKVEILNVVGEMVFSSAFTEVKNQTVNFNLNDVAAGVYFVTVRSGNETVSKKIVVR